MIETVITRNVTHATGDAEIAVRVEAKINADGQAEITRAFKYDMEWQMEHEVELTDGEEAWALSQLQAMVPEYLAGLAQKAVDDRVDEARSR